MYQQIEKSVRDLLFPKQSQAAVKEEQKPASQKSTAQSTAPDK
jgi:hypothetical protein